MNLRLLVVDDDPRILASLERALAPAWDVTCAANAESALGLVSSVDPDIVLSDVRMPGMSGVDLLRLLRERAPGADVVLMTAHDDLATVATAMREGAADFLVKPLELHQLRRTLECVCEDRAARTRTSRATTDRVSAPSLIGRDAAIVSIFKVIGQIAASRTNVVIRGESGTGKELVARAVHENSPYASEPFVAVNCTALPSTLLESELFGHVRGAFTGAIGDRRGRFAQAGMGTIFLDEIGDTTAEFQTKLLRVLQEREYYPVGADRPERTNARVVTATHRDLEQMVRDGEFREDLYYRLRVVEITIPPLRSRPGDIPLLAEHLLARAAAEHNRRPPSLSRDALDLLLKHDWPGNVRELENCLTRAVVLATGDVIRAEHLAIRGPASQHTEPEQASGLITLEEIEGRHVARVLEATRGRKTQAARLLGVSRPRLDRLIRKHGIDDAHLSE